MLATDIVLNEEPLRLSTRMVSTENDLRSILLEEKSPDSAICMEMELPPVSQHMFLYVSTVRVYREYFVQTDLLKPSILRIF